MRIALISTVALSTPPKKYGGTELMVAELAKGLIGLGHEVTVFATGDSSVFGTLRYQYERQVWPPNEAAEERHATAAWREIASDPRGYDVVHVHHAAALPPPGQARVPTVYTQHHSRMDALVERYMKHKDVAFVAISARQAALSPEIGFARAIHHGLDPELYAAGSGDGAYLAFLGRFAAEKAPHVAIDAARAAGMRLLLGGDAHRVPEAADYFQRELAPRFETTTDLEWCGELSHGPKVRLLRGASALLFPLAWEEPFGLVMIEAMLVGTPVIGFARGSAPEVIEDGVTGFLVRNEAEMVKRIRQLHLIDRDRCRERAIARWSTRRMAAEYADLYADLVRRRAQPARLPRRLPLTLPALAASSLELILPVAVGLDHGPKRE